MATQFDTLARLVHNTTANLMGLEAVWVPLTTPDVEHRAQVNFREPTDKEVMAGFAYQHESVMMEYLEEQFPGLYDAVRAGAYNEKIQANGQSYSVQSVTKKFDGFTYIAKLSPQ